MNDFECPSGFVEVAEFNELQPDNYLFFTMNNGSRCPFVANITDVGDNSITYVVAGVGDDTIRTHNIDSWKKAQARAFRRI